MTLPRFVCTPQERCARLSMSLGIGFTIIAMFAVWHLQYVHPGELGHTPSTLKGQLLAGQQQLAVEPAIAVRTTAASGSSRPGRNMKYHVITVADGNVYQQWMIRVHYYTYLKAKADCEQLLRGQCDIGGFTRLLTTGEPDQLMDEIPTFVSEQCPGSDDYSPLNRAYGYLQWLEHTTISEHFILFTEADTLFLRPVPNLLHDDSHLVSNPISFFNYSKPELMALLAPYMPSGTFTAEDSAVMQSHGNSPVMLTLRQFKKIVPHWHRLNMAMYNNETTKKEFKWMLEMYSFTLAVIWTGSGPPHLLPEIAGLPPYHTRLVADNGEPYCFAHYSYPMRFHRNGTLHDSDDFYDHADGWNFFKAEWNAKPIPRNFPAVPEAVENELVHLVASLLNEATNNIPCWDQYADEGRLPKTCDELIPDSVYPFVVHDLRV